MSPQPPAHPRSGFRGNLRTSCRGDALLLHIAAARTGLERGERAAEEMPSKRIAAGDYGYAVNRAFYCR